MLKKPSGQFWFVGLVWVVCAGAAFGQSLYKGSATQRTLQVGIDRDNDVTTGCTWMMADGSSVEGVDLVLTILYEAGGTPHVASIEYSTCNNDSFGLGQLVSSELWPIGANVGMDGTDALEAFMPLHPFGITSASRLYLQSRSQSGSFDVLKATTAGNAIVYGFPVQLPTLTPVMLIVLLVLLGGVALVIMRRRRIGTAWATSAALLLAIFMTAAATTIVLDGAVGDWSGTAPLATDPAGDSLGDDSVDLRAFYVCNDAGRLFLRVDFTNVENSPPNADPQTASTNEDTSVLLTLSGNDLEGDPLSFTIDTPPVSGTLSAITPLNATSAQVTYTPNADYFGDDSFTFVANDGNAVSAAATVSLTIQPVNDAPSFVAGPNVDLVKDLGPQTRTGWATSISPGPMEGTQTVSFAVTNSNNALFSVQPAISPNGTLTFTTVANVSGSATVTVILSDNGGTANGGVDTSAPQTFTITVEAVNDPPSFVAGPSQTVLEDAGLQTLPNWATAISPGPPDEAGQTVTFLVSSDNMPLFSVQPAVDSSGTLTFTSSADAVGMATVTVRAMDDGGTANGGVDTSAPQTFTITVSGVNDAPSIVVGSNPSVNEDSGAASIATFLTSISAGPPDESGQVVTFALTNDNNALFSVQPAISAGGTLTFTPAADATGTATVTVTAMDDGGTANGGIDTSAPQMFTITVNGVNDAPSFTAGANQSVLEDSGPQGVPGWATGISAGPPDEASQTVSFLVSNDNNGLFATQPAVDPTGTLSYTPAPDAAGTATVTVRAMDDGGTANGGVDTSAPQMFTITLDPVNDAPSFVVGSDPTVLEDSGVASLAGFLSAISPGPLDEAGQNVTFTVTNDNNGLFSVQPTIDASGTLLFSPNLDMTGAAIVTVTAMDDGGTANGGIDTSAPQMFTITVEGINDAPSFTAGASQSVFEDAGPQSVPGWATGISAGPPDEATQVVSFVVSNDNNGLFAIQPAVDASGTLSYTPAADAVGTATVSVSAMDDGGTANSGVDTSAPQMFTITLNPVNDAPSFTVGSDPSVLEDSGAATLAAFLTGISAGPPDEAGQTVTFSVTNDNNALFSVQPAIDATGTLTFTPVANTAGIATVTVTGMDDGGTANGGIDTSAPQMFIITVEGINDPPSFTAGPSQMVLEDAGTQVVDPWATAISPGPPDEAAQIVSFLVTTDNPALFSAQPVVGPTGVLTFTTAADAVGSANVMVSAMDNGGTANGGIDTSAPQTITITVTGVNDAPSFVVGSDPSVLEDTGPATLPAFLTSISPGPSDEAGQNVTFGVTNDNNALFSVQPAIDATGTLTFTPVANTAGIATVTVTGMDDGGTANGGVDTSAPQMFTITIEGINDPPSFTAGLNQMVLEDAGTQVVDPWATAISPGPPDEAAQIVSFLVTTDNPALFSAQPVVGPTGVLTFTTAADAVGSANVMVSAMDNGGTANGGIDTSAPQTFTITVNPVNDPPSFLLGGSQMVDEDSGPQIITGYLLNISPGPADEAGQTVTFAVTNDNNSLFSAQPAIDATGNLTFTPLADASGVAVVTVIAMDNGGTANGGVDTSAPELFTITINGVNDPPSFTAGASPSVLEDAGLQTLAAWATGISAGPPAESGQNVSFQLINDNNLLFSVQPAVSPTGTLTFTPAINANGVANVTITLMDDGGTANGGIDTTAPQMFTITVTSVNDAPSFTLGADPSVNEDSGPSTLAGFVSAISPGPADEAAQTVSFGVTNNNNALFSVQPAINPAGTLTFTPAADTAGVATVTVTAMDNGGTANGGIDTSSQIFTITVNGVNDVPSFSIASNPMVAEDAGSQVFLGFAFNISAGPPDEVGQTVSFLVSNDNNALFSVQPAVNTSGTLTFTSAPNANGLATVTIMAMDDGGTANGGADTSAPQMFTITVTAVNDPPTAVAAQASYDAHTHIAITVPSAAGLLVNSTDVESGTTLSMDTTPINVTAGASVTLFADGSFTVDPPANFTGTLTFDYRVSDDGIPGPGVFSPYTTVSVLVLGPEIWFVDDTASPGGTGTLSRPFQTLAAANAAATGPTDRIFLFSGAYTGGISLSNGVSLIGEAVVDTDFDTLFAIAPPVNSIARPAINGTHPVITSGSAGITLGTNNAIRGIQIANTTGAGISGNGFGTLTITDSIISGTGPALDLTNGTLAATNAFSELSSANSAGPGILLNGVGGSLSNTDTASVVTAPTGTAISVTGGNLAFTWLGSITKNNAGRVINLTSMTGGSVSLPGTIAANHAGSTGILVDNNTGGMVATFGGTSIGLNTGINNAVTLSNNHLSGGASIVFNGGGLDIDTTSGSGILATNGGNLTVSGVANTLDSTTGIALSLTNTPIVTGVTFRSISANGAVSGIILNGTGTTAGLSVVGTGGANSGGTIQNTSNAGVQLTDTFNPSFNNLRILNSARSGIKGTQVTGFTFTNGVIANSGTGLGVDDSNIAFNTTSAGTENNLSGTVTIANNTLTNALYHGVDVFNFNGTISQINVTGNTITSSTSAVSSLGSGIRLVAFGSATTVANVTRATLGNNTIRNFPSGLGIQAQGGNANAAGSAGIFGVAGDATNVIAITGNRISGQSFANRMAGEGILTVVNGRGQGNFNIANNGAVGDPIANVTGTAITCSSFGEAMVTANITGNLISANNSFGSQGIGVGVDQVPGIGDTATLTITINSNTISNTDGNGILAVARNSNGTLRAAIQNNNVAAPLSGVRPGIRVDSGTAVGNTTVCLNISGNTSAGSGGSQGIGLRKQGTAPAVNTFGVNGMAATATPAVETYINGLNPDGGGTLLISATSGFTNCIFP